MDNLTWLKHELQVEARVDLNFELTLSTRDLLQVCESILDGEDTVCFAIANSVREHQRFIQTIDMARYPFACSLVLKMYVHSYSMYLNYVEVISKTSQSSIGIIHLVDVAVEQSPELRKQAADISQILLEYNL